MCNENVSTAANDLFLMIVWANFDKERHEFSFKCDDGFVQPSFSSRMTSSFPSAATILMPLLTILGEKLS
jgi:hypothetical protein